MTIGTLYHSGHVLVLARQAYERASAQDTESEVSIALSAAAFEGFLNEIAHSFRDATLDERAVALAEVLAECEEARLQPVFKFRLAIYALSQKFPSRGDTIVQRLAALMKLRSSLMHLRPEPVFTLDEAQLGYQGEQKPPSEVALLLAERVIVIPEKYSGTWRRLVSTPAVAKWGYNVCVACMRAVAAAAPDGAVRDRMRLHVEFLADLA